MSKLLKLRKWVSLEQAARALSALLAEEVGAADLLRLALDGHLALSVNFLNGAWVRQWTAVDLKKVKWIEVPAADAEGVARVVGGGPIWSTEAYPAIQPVGLVMFSNPDIWDLPMMGGEVALVEREYQRLVGGPEPKLKQHRGAMMRTASGHLFELQARDQDFEMCESAADMPMADPADFHPAVSLPEDSVFVVRTEALTELQSKLAGPGSVGKIEVGLSTKERETLLKMIIGMAISLYGHSPDAARSKAPTEIANDLAKHGLNLTDDTVRKWLKEATRTVLPEARTKT